MFVHLPKIKEIVPRNTGACIRENCDVGEND